VGGLVVDAATGHVRPARRPAVAPPPAAAEAGRPTSPRLLLVFIVALLIPATFSLAGLGMPLYRIFLILLIVPLSLQVLQDKEHPINVVDILILLYIAWTALAVLANHGTGRVIFIGSTVIDQIGAYLIGRQLIRNAADHRLFFTYIFWALVFLAPFAVLELFTRIFPIHDVVSLFAQAGSTSGGDMRLGVFRAHTVFPHPILFGVFCSVAIANLFYVFGDSFTKRWFAALLASFLTLTSVSSGPMIALGLQWMAIAWDRVSRAIPARWLVLAGLLLLAVAVIEVAVPGGLLGLIIEEVAFNATSGRGRLEIIEYAGAEVLRNPVFGIGFNDWTRPFWRPASIDNFYLVLGVRYGLPTLVLFAGAALVHMALVARSSYRTEADNDYRLGYLISLGALLIVLGSVHIWGVMDVFVLTLIGAGQWFYAARAPSHRFAHRHPGSAGAGTTHPVTPRSPGEVMMPGPLRAGVQKRRAGR
jgi:hypothetical protein